MLMTQRTLHPLLASASTNTVTKRILSLGTTCSRSVHDTGVMPEPQQRAPPLIWVMKSPVQGDRAGAEGRLSPRRVQHVLEETKLSRCGGQGRLLSAPVSGGEHLAVNSPAKVGRVGGKSSSDCFMPGSLAFTGWGAENATEHK